MMAGMKIIMIKLKKRSMITDEEREENLEGKDINRMMRTGNKGTLRAGVKRGIKGNIR